MKLASGLLLTALLTLPAMAADQPKPALTKIKVNLSEMKMQVEGVDEGAPLVLKAGQRYKLTFENLGTIMHEVLLGRGLIHNEEENDYAEHLLSGEEVTTTGAVTIEGKKQIWAVNTQGIKEIELDPGTRLSILFTVPESSRGTWELGCFAEGHHESGMHLPLRIE
jgi:uncharacterized cupredoxin-like copper-binding protein